MRKYENLTALELRGLYFNKKLDQDVMTVEDYEKLLDCEIDLDLEVMDNGVINFCTDGMVKFEKYSEYIPLPPVERLIHRHNLLLFRERENKRRKQSDSLLGAGISRRGGKVAVFAIVAALTALLAQGVAFAFGYNSVFDLIKNAVNSSDRKAVSGNNDVVLKDDSRYYNSMREMLDAENLKILYPSDLTSEYKFTDFRVTDFGGKIEVMARSEEPYITFMVKLGEDIPFDDYEYEENGIKFNIVDIKGKVQAWWVCDSDYYTIVVSNCETLSEIIKNLKEN
jgi:hypothetical protein